MPEGYERARSVSSADRDCPTFDYTAAEPSLFAKPSLIGARGAIASRPNRFRFDTCAPREAEARFATPMGQDVRRSDALAPQQDAEQRARTLSAGGHVHSLAEGGDA